MDWNSGLDTTPFSARCKLSNSTLKNVYYKFYRSNLGAITLLKFTKFLHLIVQDSTVKIGVNNSKQTHPLHSFCKNPTKWYKDIFLRYKDTRSKKLREQV